MKIKITTDSTGDLGNAITEKYNISVMPLTVMLGDKIYKDGIDIVPQDILDHVRETGVLPKTSAPAVEDYIEFFTKYLSEGYDAVIHFNISAKASASNSNALEAVAEANLKNVYVVDSQALSTGQGLLTLKACDLAEEGMEPAEIVEKINGLIPKVNTSFIPDELDYLHKGGRCSLLTCMGAKVLKIHPMIDMKEGQLYAKKRYMGNMSVCLRKYVNDLHEMYPSYEKKRCFVTHSPADHTLVQQVIDQVSEMFTFDEIIETDAGSIVTSHCGEGTIGVLFITE